MISASMVEEGIEKAIRSQPDLIMLDVQLPDATGFQACGRLKKDPRTSSIPIIMMTGSARELSQQHIAREIMGASDYILKPFDVIEVGDRVHNLLKSTASATKKTASIEMPKQEDSKIRKYETAPKTDPLLTKLKYDYPPLVAHAQVEPKVQHVVTMEPPKPVIFETPTIGEPQIDLHLTFPH